MARLGGAAIGLVAAGFPAAPALASRAGGDARSVNAAVPTAWFDLSLDLVRGAAGFSPPVAARAFAYAGLTLYEAVLPGMPGYRSLEDLFGDLELPRAGTGRHDWPTTANAALASIFRSLIPTARPAELSAGATLEARYERGFRRVLPSGVFERSGRRGREVADAIFAWSRNDGGHEGYLRNFPPYAPPVGPGLWVPTPPSFLSALQPSWGGNRCFAIDSGASFPPGDHPPYSERSGSRFRREAREVYDSVNSLTSEEEAIARFWSDDPGATSTPPGHSVSIATQVLRREGSSLAAAAETYARLGEAVSDAFVACWYQKYRYTCSVL